jgi:signal peptidase I
MLVPLSLVSLLAGTLWWARRRLVRVDVTGRSMHPTLNDGDVVLVRRTRRSHSLRPGRLVVAERLPERSEVDALIVPRQPSDPEWIVKRIAAVSEDLDQRRGRDRWRNDGISPPPMRPETVFLLGDNQHDSRDSRHVGPWPTDRLLGVVVCRIRRAAGPDANGAQLSDGTGVSGVPSSTRSNRPPVEPAISGMPGRVVRACVSLPRG